MARKKTKDKNKPKGYAIRKENREALAKSAIQFRYLVNGRFVAPISIDPRPWHRIEDQGSIGSCQGHAQTSVGEMCFRIAHKGRKVTQWSEMFGYLTSQKIDGLLGRDVGSTIHGGMKAARQYGFCPVDVFPYPSRYTSTIPRKAYTAAKPFKIQYHTIINSSEDAFTFLGSGQGGINLGMTWVNMRPNSNGEIRSWRSGRGGGHAVFIGGYENEGEWFWLANSWSTSWGLRGYAKVHRNAMDSILRDRWTVAIGMSDLTIPKPRKIDLTMWE